MTKSISTTGGESAAQKRARGRPALHATVEPDFILRNARRTFGKRGFDATSVREIARDCGVDAALVAHRFGNKEALWAAVIDQIAEQMITTVAATVALRGSELNSARRVEHAISLLIEQVFDDPDVGLFFSTAASEEGERLEFLINRLVRPYHDALLPLLVEAIKDGVLNFADANLAFFMLLNAISNTVSYSQLLAAFSSLPARTGAFKKAVFETSMHMLGLRSS